MHSDLEQLRIRTAQLNEQYSQGLLDQAALFAALAEAAPVDSGGFRWYVDGDLFAAQDPSGNWFRSLPASEYAPKVAAFLTPPSPFDQPAAPTPFSQMPPPSQPMSATAMPPPSEPVYKGPALVDPGFDDEEEISAQPGWKSWFTSSWVLPGPLVIVQSWLKPKPARIVAIVLASLGVLLGLLGAVGAVLVSSAAAFFGATSIVLLLAAAVLVLLIPQVLLLVLAIRKDNKAAGILLLGFTLLFFIQVVTSLLAFDVVNLVVFLLLGTGLAWVALSLATQPGKLVPSLVALAVAVVQILISFLFTYTASSTSVSTETTVMQTQESPFTSTEPSAGPPGEQVQNPVDLAALGLPTLPEGFVQQLPVTAAMDSGDPRQPQYSVYTFEGSHKAKCKALAAWTEQADASPAGLFVTLDGSTKERVATCMDKSAGLGWGLLERGTRLTDASGNTYRVFVTVTDLYDPAVLVYPRDDGDYEVHSFTGEFYQAKAVTFVAVPE